MQECKKWKKLAREVGRSINQEQEIVMPLPAPNGTKRSNATEIEGDTDELIPLNKVVEFLKNLDENGNKKKENKS